MQAHEQTDTIRCLICTTSLPSPSITGRDRQFDVSGEFGVSICPGCGAGRTVPPVPPSELERFYPGDYGAYKQASGFTDLLLSRIYHRWRDRVIRSTPPISTLRSRPPGRLLDVGTGNGEPGTWAVEAGWQVVGVEPSAAACAIARSRGIDARKGTLATADLADASPFDAALFHHSLEHLPDPIQDLARVHALLSPEALLLVSVPDFGSWQSRRFGSAWYHLDLPRHRTHFTERALREALQRTRFEPVEVSRQSTVWGLPLSLQNLFLARAVPHGMGRRLLTACYTLAYPLSRLANEIGGGGDVLTIVARRA